MKVLLFLATGFEETEAVTTIDILRRAKLTVTTVSIQHEKAVIGAHNITLMADALFDDVDFEQYDAIVLPGGMPGTLHLSEHKGLTEQILRYAKNPKKTIAAICAAPSIFGKLGLTKHRKVTCYPGFEPYLTDARISRRPAVRDQNMITGDGMGHACYFALEIVEYLCGPTQASIVAADIKL